MHAKLFRIRQFIRALQRSDDARKRRWVFGASALVIALVLGVWFFYVNSAIRVASSQGEAGLGSVIATVSGPEGESIWKTLGRGFTGLADGIGAQWKATEEKITPIMDSLNTIGSGTEYTIEPPATPTP